VDFAAISQAIAGRYLAAQMTAPTGYRAIRVATDQLPNQLPPLPCVLVFPEDGDFDAGNGTRLGVHRWTARFYYDQAGDLPRAQAACLAWLTVLADQHKASVQLGGLVVYVRTVSWKIGTLTYAGKDYVGIELGLAVRTSEGWSATA
jgi:hypothetical protein